MSWLQRLPKTHPRALIGISIALTTALSSAGPYRDLQRELSKVTSPSEVIQEVSSSKVASEQSDIKAEIESLSNQDADKANVAKDLRSLVDLAALSEGRESASVKLDEVRSIKQSPFYRDQGIDRRRNWFSDALERLKNLRLKRPDPRPVIGRQFDGLGQWVVYIMWTLLVGGVLTLLYYSIRYVDWKKALTRKARTLLEDDEPERTLDEWLQLADSHSAAGRYREAVRALYLACLLKFDEHNVARFDRSETNWEHLARIQTSPLKPVDLDFTDATREFDRVWYGRMERGSSDVDLFRSWYERLSGTLGRRP